MDETCCNPDSQHPCFSCKLKYWREENGLQVDTRATPSRRNNVPPPTRESANNWEKGIVTDHRGMPYIRADGNPLGVKEMANKRSHYEGLIRQNKNGQIPLAPRSSA